MFVTIIDYSDTVRTTSNSSCHEFMAVWLVTWNCHIITVATNAGEYSTVRATKFQVQSGTHDKKTGSSLDDWIY
jgi:hypothetical protein